MKKEGDGSCLVSMSQSGGHRMAKRTNATKNEKQRMSNGSMA